MRPIAILSCYILAVFFGLFSNGETGIMLARIPNVWTVFLCLFFLGMSMGFLFSGPANRGKKNSHK
jgi:hypothetical protein